jgi:hypothetical protein
MGVAWEVEFSDEFGTWWDGLNAEEQKSVDFTVGILQELGPTLKVPHSSGVATSRHTHMRELRIQHQGRLPGVICIRSTAVGDAADRRRQDRERTLV